MSDIYFWSEDGEDDWYGPHTREEAIAEGSEGDEPFYIATATVRGLSEFLPDADFILEEAQGRMEEEEIEGDLVVTPEAERELNELLQAWGRKHLPKEYEVTGEPERVDP